ncbi:2-amino-4-hydroxy-6-hydroxymethyldihydropteridine diphosphokinase, partial [Magnetococcales bacterium HHB-1]
LDILFFGQKVIRHPRLIIPHPRADQRRFVLQPMAMISPHYQHPLKLKSIDSLLKEVNDHSHVERLLHTLNPL